MGLYEGALSRARQEHGACVCGLRTGEPVSGAPQTPFAGHVVSARTASAGRNARAAGGRRQHIADDRLTTDQIVAFRARVAPNTTHTHPVQSFLNVPRARFNTPLVSSGREAWQSTRVLQGHSHRANEPLDQRNGLFSTPAGNLDTRLNIDAPRGKAKYDFGDILGSQATGN